MTYLLHHLPLEQAERLPAHAALAIGEAVVSYADLATAIEHAANGFARLNLQRHDRVGLYLDKRIETVVASFAVPAAGGVFVPINPLLKPAQVGHILRDCTVSVFITTMERLDAVTATLIECPSVRHVIVVGSDDPPDIAGKHVMSWTALATGGAYNECRAVDNDIVALFYTSGSTGSPKGVILSHRNMVEGAKSVASYLGNNPDDVILSALPLSFDAGFSQLTTAFHSGATVALLNYLMPRDILSSLVAHKVTGLTAVPPLWIQLSQLEWPDVIATRLRYFANTGGRMPRETLAALRKRLPHTLPFLMYGLTEAFRSTYLPPEQAELRPDSIGKAIPNAEILVLRPDGSPCAPGEPGELVHRGPLVALGYWNDPERTAQRFKVLPPAAMGHELAGTASPEIAVFSGDTVKTDSEGFLYFVGRFDEMIKTSGYRVSPTELEEAIYSTKLVAEVAAFGIAHAALGQTIVVAVVAAEDAAVDVAKLLGECRRTLPAYMVPGHVHVSDRPLPRNANGKIDRKVIAADFAAHHSRSIA